MYMVSIRPDIMYSMSTTKSIHGDRVIQRCILVQLKYIIFHYLKGTTDFRILYKNEIKSSFLGFTDSDYACGINDCKSISGNVFFPL
jgi:hypothetical protein